ncbi:hypothetical protein BJ138DRAFT_1169640 [Hygrophoropsis aurantiaca]|uniref:Uncharacterized protein n=1 Tax=Hygrophoropsis aurantiaca TaxID=72124 RepID=A0ACB8ARJ0_9AGAM|nr:hypothetical protein BJ138DRAFT_1169640 [Hygrophoropsis aurantiaca]
MSTFAEVEKIISQTFDIVIIGGGTAGLCLASRLSEDPKTSVLVLEAGQANLDDPAILIPAQYAAHLGQKAYDWNFTTTPQQYSNQTQFPWSRGKGLGGSSGINFLCWTKPPQEEIDDWERLGNPGWNWERYQKYLLQIEGYTSPSPKSTAAHGLNFDDWKIGKDGPLKLSHPATITLPELKAYQTWFNLGIPKAPAPVSGNPKGAYFTPKTIDSTTFTRSYSATAFYLPNAHRPNLHVLLAANASRIITTPGSELRATGVEFFHSGRTYTVNANKEVILCAGALKSPQLLELSGIGRKNVLDSLHIPVQLELPGVGENVQEHMFGGVTFELAEGVDDVTMDILRDPAGRAEHLKLHEKGEGAFTLGITGFAFTSLASISDRAQSIYEAAREKIKANWNSYSPGLQDQYKIQLERLENASPCEIILVPGFLSFPNPPAPGKKYITILFALNHNFSRGTIHATSSNPEVDPALDPHYFEEDVDLQTFVELVKFIRKMAQTAPFSEAIASPVDLNPGPSVSSDEQIGEFLKKYSGTTFHTIGSLSMLPREKGGVVDNRLKVYGTSNIRVADLSVVPLHFAAHTMTTAYSIAEQAADIIKGKI